MGAWVVALAGCAQARITEPYPIADGQYALTSYNRAALPASLGALPPKGDTPVGCNVVVAEGALTLSAANGRFSVADVTRDACTQDQLGRVSLVGLFAQRGRDLTFRVPRTIDTSSFNGTFVAGVVTIYPGGSDVLKFK